MRNEFTKRHTSMGHLRKPICHLARMGEHFRQTTSRGIAHVQVAEALEVRINELRRMKVHKLGERKGMTYN